MDGFLKDATVYRQGTLCKRDITFCQGSIVGHSSLIRPKEMPAVPIQFSSNRIVTPGLVDVHIHLREPGFSYKETILTGTRAAAHGGYTTVCAMPNLNPPADTPAHLQEELDIIRRDACVTVLPYAAITKGRRGGGELVDFEALAPHVAGFSDDGDGVQDEDTMREAMRRVRAAGSMIAAHCEQNGLPGAESEWRQVERDLRLARETGCKYHVCHVSCRESVALVRRAKAEGADVSCETAPHYLLLCRDDVRDDGRFKMNPPLRSRADQDALLEGALDGTVDLIATDHAPHAAREKAGGFEASANGVVGLECAFAALYTGLVKTGRMPLTRLIEMMTDAPRKRFNLPPVTLDEGQPADLAVWDLSEAWTIDPEQFFSLGRATPFAGAKVYGVNLLTLAGGKTVWQR